MGRRDYVEYKIKMKSQRDGVGEGGDTEEGRQACRPAGQWSDREAVAVMRAL